MSTAAVFLADGCEEVEALTQVDFLRRAGIKVITAGIGKKTITGGHDIHITADTEVDQLEEPLDAVIMPGGMPGAEHIAKSQKANDIIQSTYRAGNLVAAICAAPAVVLAPTGILAGKKATCYPGFEERLSDDIKFSEERVVVDGNVITSRGPGTAAEFAVAIIRYLEGDKAADEIHRKTLQK